MLAIHSASSSFSSKSANNPLSKGLIQSGPKRFLYLKEYWTRSQCKRTVLQVWKRLTSTTGKRFSGPSRSLQKKLSSSLIGRRKSDNITLESQKLNHQWQLSEVWLAQTRQRRNSLHREKEVMLWIPIERIEEVSLEKCRGVGYHKLFSSPVLKLDKTHLASFPWQTICRRDQQSLWWFLRKQD